MDVGFIYLFHSFNTSFPLLPTLFFFRDSFLSSIIVIVLFYGGRFSYFSFAMRSKTFSSRYQDVDKQRRACRIQSLAMASNPDYR